MDKTIAELDRVVVGALDLDRVAGADLLPADDDRDVDGCGDLAGQLGLQALLLAAAGCVGQDRLVDRLRG